jgi:hypothetical protein
VSARIATEHEMDRSTAERIMDQALAFLGTCAISTTPISPARLVDVGWHTFILYTKEYREFCDRIAGRFIEHVPTDDPTGECQKCQQCNTCQDSEPGGGDGKAHLGALNASLTALALAEAGFVVDEPMWREAGNCSQCHNGCHNDPPPDPKVI